MANNDAMVNHLIYWGQSRPEVRVMLLTSSLVGNQASVDILSDYDVHMFVSDSLALMEDESWHDEFGTILVKCCPGWEALGIWQDSHLLLYEDGTKIDFTIAPLEVLHRILAQGTLPDFLDVGYRVLLDKDGLAASLPEPTYHAFIPPKPTEAEYRDVVNGFWWNSTYVSKYLWREDLLAVKFMLDHGLKQDCLRKMLEWSIEIDRGWNWKPGNYGRGLMKALDAETCRELIDTYAGGDMDDLWDSLFRTAALFRKSAIHVGEHLGYAYLHDLDARVMAYQRAVKSLDRQTSSHTELVQALQRAYRSQPIKNALCF